MKIIDENLDLMAKLMTASSRRHEVHASNMANINTPGFTAKDMDFEDAFRSALNNNGANEALKVEGQVVDADSPRKADGNSVHLEREFNIMQKNQMMFNIYAQLLKNKLKTIKHAIGSR